MTSSIAKGLLLMLALAACKHENPNYCPETQPGCVDAPPGCSTNDQCTAPTGVCEVATRMCVECTTAEATACTGTTPVCGSDHTCEACTAHTECSQSAACLRDGSCANATDVAYVSAAGTDNTMCSKAMPCTTVAKALATGKTYVKITGTIDEAVTLNDKNVTFIADPGAKLTRTNNGNILVIDGTSKVTIYDLEISGASGTGAGISMPSGASQEVTLDHTKIANNAGGGLSAAGGTLTVSRSTLASNIGGGIVISNAVFRIVGNVFFANGSGTATAGGVSITTSQNAMNRIEFNSFNKNQTQDGVGPAIQCTAGTFTARNNIMSGNGTLTQMDQVGGTCSHAYSIVRPGNLPSGTGNSSSDPTFVNTTTGDLHVQSGSPARGAADPNSDLTGIAGRDLDGDQRTATADMGADEIP